MSLYNLRNRTRAPVMTMGPGYQDENQPPPGIGIGKGKRGLGGCHDVTCEVIGPKRRALEDMTNNNRPIPTSCKSTPNGQNDSLNLTDGSSTSSAESFQDVSMIIDESSRMLSCDRAVANDPLYVAEYAADIHVYMRELEITTRPRANYMSKQRDISSEMRGILVDWLVEVGEEYKLKPETLYLSVNYIDRFLSKMSVTRGKLQLVGITALYIASKYEEIYSPPPNEFIYISDNTYKPEQMFRMEKLMLNALDFRMGTATSRTFAERYLKALKEKDSQYLLEITLEDYSYLSILPSLIAASVVFVALHCLGKPCWTAELKECSNYESNEIADCVAKTYELLLNAPKSSLAAVRQKYQSDKFMKISTLSLSICRPYIHDSESVESTTHTQPVLSLPPLSCLDGSRCTNRDPKMEGNTLTDLYLAAKQASGNDCAVIIGHALDQADVFVFSSLLSLPTVQALKATHAYVYSQLEVFAYGTYSDYIEQGLPPLTDGQALKLRHLTIVTLASKNKVLAYSQLLSALRLDHVRQLEDLIIEGIYRGVFKALMDQANQRLEIEWAIGRDIRPGQINDVTQQLVGWVNTSQSLLTLLDEQMKRVNAAKMAEMKRQEVLAKEVERVKGALQHNKEDAMDFKSTEYFDEPNRGGKRLAKELEGRPKF